MRLRVDSGACGDNKRGLIMRLEGARRGYIKVGSKMMLSRAVILKSSGSNRDNNWGHTMRLICSQRGGAGGILI